MQEPAIKVASGFQGGVSVVLNADSNEQLVELVNQISNGPLAFLLQNLGIGVPTEQQAVSNVVNILGGVEVPAQQAVGNGHVSTLPSPQYAPVAQPGFQQQQPQQQPEPAIALDYPGDCVHGRLKYVPGGYSKAKQKSYSAFWACPAPQGQQCRIN